MYGFVGSSKIPGQIVGPPHLISLLQLRDQGTRGVHLRVKNVADERRLLDPPYGALPIETLCIRSQWHDYAVECQEEWS